MGVDLPDSQLSSQVSPDGRWIAYESAETLGEFEIVIRPFPDLHDGRWQVSLGDDPAQPIWSSDGRELYYLVGDGGLMVVSINSSRTLDPGRPERLLEGPYVLGGGLRSYDVSPDGRRFLMIKEPELDRADAESQIVVIENWFTELERLVPTN